MTRLVLLTLAVIAVNGCASSHVIDAGPEAQISYDGLVRVDSSRVENFWARPDIDYASYTKIVLADPEIEFRAPSRSDTVGGSTEEFPLSEADQQSLVLTVKGIFLEELADNRYFTFVEDRGPDVLTLDVRLLDFVALVPKRIDPDDPSFVYFSSAGEMTLVVEAHDSITGEILARAVERRAAGIAAEGIHSSRRNGWAEINPLARHWAEIIRERLDQIHEADTFF
jgi:hypothetical protein